VRLVGVQRGGRDDELEVGPALHDALEQAEEDVGVDGALVRLVQHDHAVGAEPVVQQRLAQEHAVRHVLDHRLGPGAVLEADGVAHLRARAAFFNMALARRAGAARARTLCPRSQARHTRSPPGAPPGVAGGRGGRASSPRRQPTSSLTRLAMLMAATRRGCVQPMRPRDV